MTKVIPSSPTSAVSSAVKEPSSFLVTVLPKPRPHKDVKLSDVISSWFAVGQTVALTDGTVKPVPVTVNVYSPASVTVAGSAVRVGPSCAEAALAPAQVTSANAIAMNTNLVLVMT